MKNLRILSLYKIILLLVLITSLLTFYRINNLKYEKKEIETNIYGYINDIKKNNENIQIELISDEKILIYYTNKDNINLKLGDKISIKGTLNKPKQNTTPNLFNYRKYLLSKKIKYIVYAKEITKLEDNDKISYKIKNKIINHLESYKTSNYLKTFLLGDNSYIDDNVKKTYQNNGISHLFAVSGMHLSLFSAIIISICRKLKINDNITLILTTLFLIFFAFLSNYTPSVLRALFMFILINIKKKLNLNIETIYILLLILSGMLLYNPFYIYNIGFIFSFTISFFLIIYNKLINKQKNYFKKIFITSTISFLASIPIMIQNFYQINILTPLLNLIFVPFISFIVFPFSLITSFIKPFDNIFLLIINILESITILFNKLSLDIVLSCTPWYYNLIYYLLIILFINGIKTNNKIKLIPLILIIIIHHNIKKISNYNEITILDVGQGDSSLIELKKDSGNILIDTGGNYNKNYSIVINQTIIYLKSHGIKKLDYLIITHGDFDHMGEAINLVNNFKVEKVIFNCGEFNELEQELIKVLEKKKIPYYSCIKELNIGDNKLYFLNNKIYDNENDNSSVIYTGLNNHKFLFMGDAGVEVEENLLEKYNLKNIDVLKVGHHGSKTSSSKEFVYSIVPKYSIISVGNKNRYGHPNKEVLNNLENSKIYRTDEDGSIMFMIKNNKLKIETCSP